MEAFQIQGLEGRSPLLQRAVPLRVLAMALALLVALACGPGRATPTPLSSPTPAPDARTILESSGRTMARLDTFHFEMGHKGGGTPVAEGLVVAKVQGDVVKPDMLDLSWEGSFLGFFVKAQVVSTGGETYMTNPITGRWETIDGEVNPLGFFDPSVGIASIMADLTGASLVGVEALGDDQAYRIRGLLPSRSLVSLLGNVAQDLMVETEAWIGVDGMLLRQVVFRGRVTPEEVEGITRTIGLSRFNHPVSIAAPKVE